MSTDDFAFDIHDIQFSGRRRPLHRFRAPHKGRLTMTPRSQRAGTTLLDLGAPAEAIKADFARRLQKALNDKGWNQSDLARAADIGRDSVSVYLRGKSLPGPKHLTSISKAFGVGPNDLLPGVEDAATARGGLAAMEITQSTAAGRVWLKINRSVSLKQLQAIIGILASEPAGEDS